MIEGLILIAISLPPPLLVLDIVTTSRYVVPTGRVKVPAGRYVVPTGKDNVIVSTGLGPKVIPADRKIFVTVLYNLNRLEDLSRAGPSSGIRASERASDDAKGINGWHCQKPDLEVSESEGLHNGYDRFQKILSQLNQMQAKPDNEDSLGSEIDVKGGSSYDSRGTAAPTHSAFISAASTNSKMSYPDQSHSTTFTSASSSPAASSNVIENELCGKYVCVWEFDALLAQEWQDALLGCSPNMLYEVALRVGSPLGWRKGYIVEEGSHKALLGVEFAMFKESDHEGERMWKSGECALQVLCEYMIAVCLRTDAVVRDLNCSVLYAEDLKKELVLFVKFNDEEGYIQCKSSDLETKDIRPQHLFIAGSRNRLTSVLADSRNSPTSVPARRPFFAGWKNHAARPMTRPTSHYFQHFSRPGYYTANCIWNEGRIGNLLLQPLVEFQLPKNSQVVLRVPRRNNLYCFNLTEIQPERDINCLLAKASSAESTKWHRRMAHVNFKNINKLEKHGLVNGLPSYKLFTNEHNCVAYNKGKQHKASYKAITAVSTISAPLQLLHMDLFSPTSIRSIDHKAVPRLCSRKLVRLQNQAYEYMLQLVRSIRCQADLTASRNRCSCGTDVDSAAAYGEKLPIGKQNGLIKNKRDARGIVVRNKSRLVAQGHRQEECIDYDEGFEDPHFPKHVYRVVKALYGLHQAPRAWDIILVQVYVDAIIFGSTNKAWCDDFEVLMKGEFKMSAMGELTFFLGLQVKQKPDGIFISQDKYVQDMLKKFNIESVPLMNLTELKGLDIQFAVSACSRHQVTPLTSNLNAVKKIFKYLKGQPKLGLWYPRDSPFVLEAYSDSDYAGSHGDRKSTTGGCQFLGRRYFRFKSNDCYGFNFMNTKIFIDNQSTICIVKNPVFHQRTKHIEIRHHFIRDANEKNLIQVLKIHTDENVADLLTKAFDGPRFNHLVVHIGMLNP
ncbi:putative ribonuclease H-like domain-containing protein [Tanacetum coccineum]